MKMYIDGTNIINECNEQAVNSDDNINKDNIPVIGPFSSAVPLPFIPVILSALSQNFADPSSSIVFAEAIASIQCEEKEKIIWNGSNNNINIHINISSSFNPCNTIKNASNNTEKINCREGIPISTKCNKEINDTFLKVDKINAMNDYTLHTEEKLAQQAQLPAHFDYNHKKENKIIKLSVKEQKARANAWAKKEFGLSLKTKNKIIKLSVEEQKARANEWAIKEFGHLLDKKET